MKKARLVVAIVLGVLVAGGTAWAAVDMFLKVGDVKGESHDDKHKDEIDVLSWSWGVSNAGGTDPRGAGRAVFQNLTVVKYVDRATVPFFLAIATGRHYPEALLTVRKAGERPLEYIKIKLRDVIVTSLGTGGSGAEDRLTEEISLNYGEIEITYTSQNPDGTGGAPIVGSYSVVENR